MGGVKQGRHDRRGRRGELKGKCKKYITNLSPLALPSPYTHTHFTVTKSQRGGRDLIRLSAVHHTQERAYRALQGKGGRCLQKKREEGRGRNEIELIGAVKCARTHTYTH